jgi:hypothetical protein
MDSKITEFRNAVFSSDGAIQCEVNHLDYGWLPFTASPNDPEKHGRDIFALIIKAGGVADYVKPENLPYAPSDLSPRRFNFLLAITGLGDVWDAIEASVKSQDRASYALLKAHRSSASFSQAKTIGLVAMFADAAKRVAPDADLSDAAIKAAWIQAEQVQL